MSVRTLALVGRYGEAEGRGRYLSPNEWPKMRKAAWQMHRANQGPIQVWRAMQNGDLLGYDGDATRKLSDWLVAQAQKELRS